MQTKAGRAIKTNGSVGKISTLPPDIRAEINRRLHLGHMHKEIAAWLETQEVVRQIMAEKWEGQPVDRSAISRWRDSGYKAWQREHAKVEQLKELSDFALRLGEAVGGSIADGSAVIVGGRILEKIETTSDEDIHKMVHSICELRAGDIRRVQAAQGEKRIALAGKKLELERKKYQRQTAQTFMEWHKDKRAQEILESRDNNAEKLEKLGRAIFGEDW